MKAALRLRRPADFARVRSDGVVYRHSALLLSVCANGLPHNRYGFVVGGRIGNAVRRNRCKRRLRALIDRFHDRLQPGSDIVLIARKPVLGQPFDELQRILGRLFARARLMEA